MWKQIFVIATSVHLYGKIDFEDKELLVIFFCVRQRDMKHSSTTFNMLGLFHTRIIPLHSNIMLVFNLSTFPCQFSMSDSCDVDVAYPVS